MVNAYLHHYVLVLRLVIFSCNLSPGNIPRGDLMLIETDELIDTYTASRMLGIPQKTLYSKPDSELQRVRIATRVFYRRKDVEELAAKTNDNQSA